MHGITRFRTTFKGTDRFCTADRHADWGSDRQIGDLAGTVYWGSGRYSILGVWQVKYIGDLAGTLYWGSGRYSILGIYVAATVYWGSGRYIRDLAGTVFGDLAGTVIGDLADTVYWGSGSYGTSILGIWQVQYLGI